MPTTPGYAHCTIQIALAGMSRAAFVTFGVDPSTNDPDAIAVNVSNWFQVTGGVRTLFDTSCTVGPTTIYYGQDGGEDLVGVSNTTITGGRSGTSPTPNVAILVNKRTASGGRRNRGRMYLPWAIDATDLTENGQISSSRMPSINTALATSLAELTTRGVPMVVLHKPGLTPAGAPTPVVSTVAVQLISTQRRRLGR